MTTPGRYRIASVALIALFLLAPGFAQAPATHEQHRQPAATQPKPVAQPEKTAVKNATEREEIFCSSMKTGQLCPDSTARILGLTGAQAEAWKAILRKYNKSADDAALQLQKDSAAKLTPEQMEVLKAWFAVGWNEEINEILYKRNLDDINKADTQGLSTRKPEEHDDH